MLLLSFVYLKAAILHAINKSGFRRTSHMNGCRLT